MKKKQLLIAGGCMLAILSCVVAVNAVETEKEKIAGSTEVNQENIMEDTSSSYSEGYSEIDDYNGEKENVDEKDIDSSMCIEENADTVYVAN